MTTNPPTSMDSGVMISQQSRQHPFDIIDSIVDVFEKHAKQTQGEVLHIKPFLRSNLRNPKTKKESPETFLHMLPGELRNGIYHLVGFSRRRRELRGLEMPVLAHAFPSLRSEILAMLFAESEFKVDAFSRFLARGELTSTQRVEDRGGTFGTGRLAIERDSWIWRADPRAIAFHHIFLHIREMDGAVICKLILNVTKKGKRNGPRMSTTGITSQHIRSRLKLAKAQAAKYVNQLKEIEDFPGFSLKHLRDIAKFFEDPGKLRR